MATAYTRTLVHLVPPQGGLAKPANFAQCILSALQPNHTHSTLVNVELKDGKLLLSLPTPSSPPPVLLTHPSFCPAHCLTTGQAAALPEEAVRRGVDVGVVVLLETADHQLLLTRRAKHMRTFPCTWVPPGGHVEEGEGLLEAGMRELEEETGLQPVVTTSSILALWESTYPYSLNMGMPKRHHIVTYYWVRSSETSIALESRLRLDASEVDAAMWLSPTLARLVATGEAPPDCPPQVALTVVAAGGQEADSLPSSVLTRAAPEGGRDVERISTGTRYALQQWAVAREA